MHHKQQKFKERVNGVTTFLLVGFVGLSAYAVADQSGTTVWQLLLNIGYVLLEWWKLLAASF